MQEAQNMDPVGKPGNNRQLWLFSVCGVFHGVLLAWVQHNQGTLYFFPRLHAAVYFSGLLIPWAVFFSSETPARKRFCLVACAAAVAIGAGIYQGWVFSGGDLALQRKELPFYGMLLLLAGFLVFPMAGGRPGTNWQHALLDNLGILCGGIWGLLLVACLLGAFFWPAQSLGMFPQVPQTQLAFWLPVVFAVGAGLACDARAQFRAFAEWASRTGGWLFYVAAFGSIALFVAGGFLHAAPHLGMVPPCHAEGLFCQGRFSFAWGNPPRSVPLYIAVLVFLFNLRSRLGTQEEKNRLLSWIGLFAWLAASLAALATCWNIHFRMQEDGVATELIWAMFANCIAFALAFGYFLAHFPGIFFGVAKANGIAAGLVAAGILAACLGLADPRRISATLEMKRLASAKLDEAERVVQLLGQDKGFFGRQALAKVASGKVFLPIGIKGRIMQLAQREAGALDSRALVAQEKALAFFAGFPVVPADAGQQPQGLAKALARHFFGVGLLPGSAGGAPPGVLWKIPLGDGAKAAYVPVFDLGKANRGGAAILDYGHASVWQEIGGRWQETGKLKEACDSAETASLAKLYADVVSGQARPALALAIDEIVLPDGGKLVFDSAPRQCMPPWLMPAGSEADASLLPPGL
jgi:hypothetical protein